MGKLHLELNAYILYHLHALIQGLDQNKLLLGIQRPSVVSYHIYIDAMLPFQTKGNMDPTKSFC